MSGVINFFQHPFTHVTTWQAFVVAALLSTLVFVGILAALHRLSPPIKKWMTITCTFLAGLFFTLEFFLPTHTLPTGQPGNLITPYQEKVSDFILLMMLWTLGLGIISLMIVHGRRLVKRMPMWHNSLGFFIAMFSIIVFGLMTWMGGTARTGLDGAKTVYNSLFYGLLVNLDAAMFATLAFYIASAAYRAFRVRTVEAALLMVSALIVMLGLVEVGVMLTSWIPTTSGWSFFRLEVLSQWVLNWPNAGAYRAVLIGVGVGALAMAMRLWLSLERGTFFSQE